MSIAESAIPSMRRRDEFGGRNVNRDEMSEAQQEKGMPRRAIVRSSQRKWKSAAQSIRQFALPVVVLCPPLAHRFVALVVRVLQVELPDHQPDRQARPIRRVPTGTGQLYGRPEKIDVLRRPSFAVAMRKQRHQRHFDLRLRHPCRENQG